MSEYSLEDHKWFCIDNAPRMDTGIGLMRLCVILIISLALLLGGTAYGYKLLKSSDEFIEHTILETNPEQQRYSIIEKAGSDYYVIVKGRRIAKWINGDTSQYFYYSRTEKDWIGMNWCEEENASDNNQ